MLLALMDGSARPATELAAVAKVTPPTASFHLGRLVTGGLLAVEAAGRHRYYRLAGAAVAEALEAVALIHPRRPDTANREIPPERLALVAARTCYRHLAGRLGVAWLASLERARLVGVRDGALALTRRGVARFEELGLAPARWPPGKTCLDWTERRYHLGGPLGTLLTDHLFAKKWLARRRDGRAVRITPEGERALPRHFALPLSNLRP